MKIKAIVDEETLVGVVYEYEKKYIGAESRSSMGFTTFKQALFWVVTGCEGRIFGPEDGTYKMMPNNVKTEIQNQLNNL